MKITTEMTVAAYVEAKAVYHKRKSKNEALDQLKHSVGMNRGSASDFIDNFKKMMDGEKYVRTNNTEQTRYFFSEILNDYGAERLHNALNATVKHVDYYEGLGRGNLNSIRSVIQEYFSILDSNFKTIFPDEIVGSEKFTEGSKKTIIVNSYERNPDARQKCIEHYGLLCSVCAFDFEKVYGEIGMGFIHVHHLKPLSEIGEGYKVDPVKDLRPVCPNCHAMLHRMTESSIDGLKKSIHKC